MNRFLKSVIAGGLALSLFGAGVLSCAIYLVPGFENYLHCHGAPGDTVKADWKIPAAEIKAGGVAKFDARKVVSSGTPAYVWGVWPEPTDSEIYEGGQRFWVTGEEGTRYFIALATYENGGVNLRETSVTFGKPTPKPVPPKPEPTPTNGPRIAMIVHETATDTPEFSSMVVKLRNGVAAKYIADKQHSLWVLDKDETESDGKQSKLIAAYQKELAGMSLPAIVVVDLATFKVTYKQELKDETTADNIVEYIKKGGG